jgi:Ca2+-binding EF-hand superfamily protein
MVSDGAFEAVDTDKSGELERDELQAVLKNVAFDMSVKMPTDGDVDAVLRQVDNDGDGNVSKDEFYELISKVL